VVDVVDVVEVVEVVDVVDVDVDVVVDVLASHGPRASPWFST
jgi:hypothetical protein